ncbi:MAG: CinA family protein [Bacilli bacterium]|nr:CinA family protein [Bacilli bacterium]
MEAKDLVNLLIKKKLTIGSVESLTAGLFIATLANVPGASKVVRGSLVTYQSSFKTSLLGIKKQTIDKYGVVSRQVATEMVLKGKKLLKTDIVVSFTGNAGPTKEKGGAEVGRVHMAILCQPNAKLIKNISKVYHGDRNTIRTKVVDDMINAVYQIVKKK